MIILPCPSSLFWCLWFLCSKGILKVRNAFLGLDEVDYSLFPEKPLQEDWIKTYLTEFYGKKPSGEEIEGLYLQVNKFVLLAHIFWGIWSLIQAEHSTIDFDYLT